MIVAVVLLATYSVITTITCLLQRTLIDEAIELAYDLMAEVRRLRRQR